LCRWLKLCRSELTRRPVPSSPTPSRLPSSFEIPPWPPPGTRRRQSQLQRRGQPWRAPPVLQIRRAEIGALSDVARRAFRRNPWLQERDRCERVGREKNFRLGLKTGEEGRYRLNALKRRPLWHLTRVSVGRWRRRRSRWPEHAKATCQSVAGDPDWIVNGTARGRADLEGGIIVPRKSPAEAGL
jgi:hypothetical protein